MNELPKSFAVDCESCKKPHSTKAIQRTRGVCPTCGHDQWHLYVDFGLVMDEGTALVKTAVVNVVGLSLLAATGLGFTAKVSKQTKTQKSTLDFHFLPPSEILEICDPSVKPLVQVGAFVARKQHQQFLKHKSEMEERGGSHCDVCDVLFVPMADKPWTMVGTCSKSCCAAKFNAQDYSRIENEVIAATQGTAAVVAEQAKSESLVTVQCPCGYRFQLKKMYCGLRRKCPSCDQKVFVPEN